MESCANWSLMQAKDVKLYDDVIWKSRGLNQQICSDLRGGGSLVVSNQNPIEFVGTVYGIKQAVLRVYWVACKIDTSDGFSIITRQSIEDKESRHAMFGTVHKNPTYKPFVDVGLTSINVDMNSPDLIPTSKAHNVWWAPVMEGLKKQWSCCIS